jgi:protocatechuate 3,4-dioxygenase beta subunit
MINVSFVRAFQPRSVLLVVRLCLLACVYASGPSRAEERTPEATIPRLAFRVADFNEGPGPVESLWYSYTIYAASEKEPLTRPRTAYRVKDGILRIPQPFPAFGRICLCVEADDPQRGYRCGYGAFSYEIDETKAAEPPTIHLVLETVVTGTVIDAETGKPIAGAEVAPVQPGHIGAWDGSWPRWVESVKADGNGKYRITNSSYFTEDIAARHADYREGRLENRFRSFKPGHNITEKMDSSGSEQQPEKDVGPEGFVLRLHRLIALRGRAVDPQGKPIADVEVCGPEFRFPDFSQCASHSDAQGRFVVKVTRDEWNQQKDIVGLFAKGYRSLQRPLKGFSLDGELTVTLQPQQLITGQVLDEAGRQLEDCNVELKQESGKMSHSEFDPVPGPYKRGKWEYRADEHCTIVTLRVSLAGAVRSLKRYTLAEVSRGPIITRLAEGRRLTGRLIARVPLNPDNTPVVLLSDADTKELSRQALVQPDGRFTFFGLADGHYLLRLYPALSDRHDGRARIRGAGVFSVSYVTSHNKVWDKSVAVNGRDLHLDPIDLHREGLLPGRITGAVFQPVDGNKTFASAFGCIYEDFDAADGLEYVQRFMTDAEGRFRIENCAPGKYVLHISDNEHGLRPNNAALWIRVTPEKTNDMRLFAPDAELSIRFAVGDGSLRHLYAGAALDRDVITKHLDEKKGRLRYIDNEGDRLRAEPAQITCKLEPLDDAINHWPICSDQFEFIPGNLKDARRHMTIPNVTPGRWRLTLTAESSCHETLPTRDVVFTAGMAPLEIQMPAAALAGSLDSPLSKPWDPATIDAIPSQPGLPTRTCGAQESFRFIGLAPGTYTLRVRAKGCVEKQVAGVVVEHGKTTWLEKTVLKPAKTDGARQKGTDKGSRPL